jgi:hypothetical protein
MKAKSAPRKVFPTTWPKQERLPAGAYDACINYASYQYLDLGKYGRVYLSFLITEGEYEGALEYKHYYLTSTEAYDHLKKDFLKFGVVAKDGDKLVEACNEMLGKQVRIRVQYDAIGSKFVFLSQPAPKGNGHAARN